MIHILTLAILYTSSFGVGDFHGHAHEHHGDAEICAAGDDASAPAEQDPCSRMDCDSDACCSVHSHHLLAVGASIATDQSPTPSDLNLLEPQSYPSEFPQDIFHPPRIY